MEILQQGLNLISSSLLIPVIALLLFFFVKSLFLIGKFYGVFTDKVRSRKWIEVLISKVKVQPVRSLESGLINEGSNLSGRYFRKLQEEKWHPLHGEKLLSDFELEIQKELERAKLLIKIGPMLGLMGTLIPMGPALAGLSTGNISTMVQNVQIAFATTVVGVFIGGIGFVVHQIEQRWFVEDLQNLRYFFELAKSEEHKKEEILL